MSKKHIHIISFDVPYPADYGGVIDVFYKIKSLSELGIKIHLHCFQYGRNQARELEKYCFSINYYERKVGILQNLSLTPYIIKSRISKILIENIKKDNYPILCEGMHTCGIFRYLDNRFIIYRSSNIEHEYYKALARSESSFIRKLYFRIEAIKLALWEKKLAKADLFLTVSKSEQLYYKSKFPDNKVENIYSFYNQDKKLEPDFNIKGDFILFHGNLSVQENIETAKFIITEIAPKNDNTFYIAGRNPDNSIISMADGIKNVKILANLDDKEMNSLISKAQINLLLTQQATGLKLKLLNSLHQGKHCIVNDKMLTGTGLEACVEIANTSTEIINKINELMEKEFTESDYRNRGERISSEFDNIKKAEFLVKLIY